MENVEISVDYGGRSLTLQTGKLAKQTDASVLVRYGDTMVLVTVVAAKDVKPDQGFFPLTVDFQEKYYSAGRVPGGFFKREARPSEKATLSARLIDRPIRPLFPEDFLAETYVVATVLSNDGVNDSDVVASIGASAALHISDIPWSGPVATCRVGLINGNFVCNPIPTELVNSQLELLVSGVPSGVIMVEGSAKEVSEKQMMDAIDFAHAEMRTVFNAIDELRSKAGKNKREYEKPVRDEKLKSEMRKYSWPMFEKAFAIPEKLARYQALDQVKETVQEKFGIPEPKTTEDSARNALVAFYLGELKATYAREKTLNTQARIDGRSYSDIRQIHCETGLLPRVHGSALFTRGETQVLATVTLGTSEDEQKIDAITGVYQKTFLLHYNFPPFSVGEARPLRPPGRREIGHGYLAERALGFVVPPKEKFPYTVRLVSEVLESNGSSSMATVCSGSLALMDAGVPIPKPVAGVAMGLIKENEKVAVLSDILGDEDHLGDMDFKVCGTADGVTAFQMDLKIGGISREIMEKALDQAREGRLHILSHMNATLSEPRAQFSPYAPRIFVIRVKPDKVREVIGSGGKVIRSIIERTGVKIDIEDDGQIHIASSDETSAQKAIEIINQIVEEPEPGKIYEGKVTRIADFGAFVEIIPGTDGLCHISELAHFRVRRVEDVVKEGEVIKVKCLEVDTQGKIRLSRRALLPKDSVAPSAPRGGGGGRPSQESRESEDDGDSVGNRSEPRIERESRQGGRFERPERGGERSFSENRYSRGRSFDRDRGGERPREGAPRERGRSDRGGSRDNRYGRSDQRPPSHERRFERSSGSRREGFQPRERERSNERPQRSHEENKERDKADKDIYSEVLEDERLTHYDPDNDGF